MNDRTPGFYPVGKAPGYTLLPQKLQFRLVVQHCYPDFEKVKNHYNGSFLAFYSKKVGLFLEVVPIILRLFSDTYYSQIIPGIICQSLWRTMVPMRMLSWRTMVPMRMLSWRTMVPMRMLWWRTRSLGHNSHRL